MSIDRITHIPAISRGAWAARCKPSLLDSIAFAFHAGRAKDHSRSAARAGAPGFDGRFSLTVPRDAPYNCGDVRGFHPIVRCEAPMLRIFRPNSSSEHALFIRLFLTGGGGW